MNTKLMLYILYLVLLYTANRKYGSTKFNEHSSRSHTVFRVTLNHKKTDHVCKMGILVSTIHMLSKLTVRLQLMYCAIHYMFLAAWMMYSVLTDVY